VFPRLVASEYRSGFVRTGGPAALPNWTSFSAAVSKRIEHADSGPAGTGKSLLAIVFVVAAIARGEKAALSCSTKSSACCSRMKGLGIDLEEMQRGGNLFVDQVDARSCRLANSPTASASGSMKTTSRPW